jgi:hypothetical protein
MALASLPDISSKKYHPPGILKPTVLAYTEANSNPRYKRRALPSLNETLMERPLALRIQWSGAFPSE